MSRCICWSIFWALKLIGVGASSPAGRAPGRSSRRAQSGTSAAGPLCAAGQWTSGISDQVVAPDVAGGTEHVGALGIRVGRRLELEVGGHAAHRDGPAEDAAHAVLEGAPAPVSNVAQEELALREAQGDDRPVHRDRAARLDEWLRRRVAADQGHDLGPATAQLGERVLGGGSGGREGGDGLGGGSGRGRCCGRRRREWSCGCPGRGRGRRRRGRWWARRRRGRARWRGRWGRRRDGRLGSAAGRAADVTAAGGVAGVAPPATATWSKSASSSARRRPPGPGRAGSMAASRRAAAATEPTP